MVKDLKELSNLYIIKLLFYCCFYFYCINITLTLIYKVYIIVMRYKVMKEEKYVLKNIKSFEPRHIFECGQCFRWNKNEDNTYTGVLKNGVINVQEKENEIIFTGICLSIYITFCRWE